MDFHRQLSAQFPLRAHRVVYTKSGNTLAAARLEDTDESVIDHKLYWAGCGSVAEAQFLTAVLNSGTLLAQVAKYQARGLFGARDFDKYVFQIGIPMFNPTDPTHQELAGLAARAETVAAAVTIPAGIRFVGARSIITAALLAEGVRIEIDAAVEALLP